MKSRLLAPKKKVRRDENQLEMEWEVEKGPEKKNKGAHGFRAKFVVLKKSWCEDILRRLLQNYSYKVSMYIIFKATARVDKEQMGRIRKELGLSWNEKQQKNIAKEVEVVRLEIFGMYRSDVLRALIESACDPEADGYKDRKLYFEMLK